MGQTVLYCSPEFNDHLSMNKAVKLVYDQPTCNLVTKLWVLGFLLEPFLYFVLADRTQAGITINLARFFQLLLIITVSLHLLSGNILSVPKKSIKCLRPIFLFFFIAIFFSSILLSIKAIMNINLHEDYSSFANMLNGMYIRPILEIVILAYQLVYFLVMPSIFLKTKADFKFLFRAAFVLLFLHFVLGWFDFIFSGMGFDLLARHFHDGIYVSQRFHGLAGEPRDASVLILSFFLFFGIYSIYRHGQVREVRWPIIILLIISWIATASFSGVLALIFGFILYLLYGTKILSIKSIFKFFFYALALAILVFVLMNYVERLFNYFDTYSNAMLELIANPFMELPHIILVSYNNLFPIIMMYKDVESGNVLPLLFGYGIGSSGQINAVIYSEFNNPNSQIIRFLYEFGLFGTLLFIGSFLSTVRLATQNLSVIDAKRIKLFIIITIGAFFAHKGYFLYMGIGLLVSVANYRLDSIRPRLIH